MFCYITLFGYICRVKSNYKRTLMKKLLLTVLATAAMGFGQLGAVNPYLPLWEFIPDGEPYVFEDPDNPGQYRVYVYGSHDNLIQYYCGRDQVVWSAPVDNLMNWRLDGTIFENKKNAKGQYLYADSVGDVLYAPDVTLVTDANGKKTYYLYPNVQHDLRSGLIAKSDRPDGPFEVCNWDPKDPDRTTGILRFDPAVFVDDDGRVYGYWGFERSYGAELDPNTMCTVKPGTKVVEDMVSGRYQEGVYHFFEASSIRKIKDKYVFIYSRWAQNGEWGLPETNYTLAYCYSNSPLGPWTYGGTIIDGRGREPFGSDQCTFTATPTGNTHGSICEIDGKWWVFYHRQAGTSEYSRQAMVAAIDVEVTEGPEGTVKITEGEFTSEGFEVNGLNPMEWHSAGIACYFTGPEPAHQEYPNVIYPGSHTEIHRLSAEALAKVTESKDWYNEEINTCYMVNNVDGSTVGYKYFNFDSTSEKKCAMMLKYIPEGIDGTVTIWMDRPSEEEGGTKLAELVLNKDLPLEMRTDCIPLDLLSQFKGKHALFFTFSSDTKGQSLCKLCSFCFVENITKTSTMTYVILGLALLACILGFMAFRKKSK